MPDGVIPKPLSLRAGFIPTSVDETERTVIATVSTGAGVVRHDPNGTRFLERLDLNGIDAASLVGLQVLNCHRADGLENIVGVVVDAGRDTGGLWAKIKFSERHAALFADVTAGIIRFLSVGYRVSAWRADQPASDGMPVRTATRWQVAEISFVTYPADPAAQVRKESGMPDTVIKDPPDAASADTQAAAKTEFKPCPECATPAGCAKLGGCVVAADDGAEDESAQGGETTRAAMPRQQIRTLQRSLGLPEVWARDLITRGADEMTVRSEAFAALATSANGVRSEQPRIQIVRSNEDPYQRALWMGEALYVRANGGTLSEAARQYAYATPAEMARDLLTLRGVAVVGMSPAAIITRSLNTTSDFPVILGETIGRTLRAAYQAAPSGIRAAARVASAKDFRTKTALQLSEAPILKKLTEGGEIAAGSMAEAAETYKVETFARKVGITRQALVNDDLGAFSDLSRRFGQAAAETEALELVALLTKNAGAGPKLSDDTALFHTSRGNLAASGAAISDTSLSAARAKMRTAKGPNGQIISAPPKYLVVPAALETTGEKWITSITPADAASVNPFSGKLELLVEPRLDAISATRWYLTADPAVIDGLEIAYLTGSNGPLVEPVKDADTDGVTLKVIHDFGVGFVEWRSWYANPGA